MMKWITAMKGDSVADKINNTPYLDHNMNSKLYTWECFKHTIDVIVMSFCIRLIYNILVINNVTVQEKIVVFTFA